MDDFYNYNQEDFNIKKPNYKKYLVILVIFIILGYFAFNLGTTYNKITVNNKSVWLKIGGIFSAGDDNIGKEDLTFPMPIKEPDRLDILILGIRGEDDPNGGLLTDSIMVLSLNKITGQTAIISLPRDLYAKISDIFKGKVNEIYEKGLYHEDGSDFSKEIFSRISGIYIDNFIVFDFKSFEKIVDTLGGIDVVLERPFEEKQQWGYLFSLPAGKNHLNGQDALYYARSRYNSNDFDRARRQQEILLAIKNKISSLGILSNPLKINALIKVFGDAIKTDLNIWDLNDIVDLAKSFKATEKLPKRFVVSSENIVYETFQDSIYILLPSQNDYKIIQNTFKNIFQQ